MPVVANEPLDGLNSFAVAATARYYCAAQTVADIGDALTFADRLGLPVLVLGGGSNLLLRGDYPGLVLHICLKGVEFSDVKGGLCRVVAAAGENWHGLVETCLQRGLHGLENLALIPGTVGAAPIQNIGAYGVELAESVESVTVLDRTNREVRQISQSDCQFGYRDSVFKQPQGANLIVIALSLNLAVECQPRWDYGSLRAYLVEHQGIKEQGSPPSHQQVFDAVCAIRRSKLPDPASLGNAGSFFKNPLVSESKRDQLLADYPEMPWFESQQPGLVKIPAAWLLEQRGWRGKRRGRAAVSDSHALVLTNPAGASGEEIMLLAQEMAGSVLNHFGIALESEVRIV